MHEETILNVKKAKKHVEIGKKIPRIKSKMASLQFKTHSISKYRTNKKSLILFQTVQQSFCVQSVMLRSQLEIEKLIYKPKSIKTPQK